MMYYQKGLLHGGTPCNSPFVFVNMRATEDGRPYYKGTFIIFRVILSEAKNLSSILKRLIKDSSSLHSSE